jgi:hypothetical protein
MDFQPQRKISAFSIIPATSNPLAWSEQSESRGDERPSPQHQGSSSCEAQNLRRFRRESKSRRAGLARVNRRASSASRPRYTEPACASVRVRAAVGPWLGSALVERNLAIVDPLFVLPFFSEPFFASQRPDCSVRGRCRISGLVRSALRNGLRAGRDRRERSAQHDDCHRSLRHKRHRFAPERDRRQPMVGWRRWPGTPFLAVKLSAGQLGRRARVWPSVLERVARRAPRRT